MMQPLDATSEQKPRDLPSPDAHHIVLLYSLDASGAREQKNLISSL
jgi:hypothetical protein